MDAIKREQVENLRDAPMSIFKIASITGVAIEEIQEIWLKMQNPKRDGRLKDV